MTCLQGLVRQQIHRATPIDTRQAGKPAVPVSTSYLEEGRVGEGDSSNVGKLLPVRQAMIVALRITAAVEGGGEKGGGIRGEERGLNNKDMHRCGHCVVSSSL